MTIWSRLNGHAEKTAVANPLPVNAIAHARIKTDKVDARTLAHLLRGGLIPAVVIPDPVGWEL